MPANPSILNKIVNAKATQSGNYIKPGDYLFEIQKVDIFQGYKAVNFLVELLVLESSGENANKPGTLCSLVVNIDNVCGPGNAKAFVMALFNVPEEEVTNEVLAELISEDVRDASGKITKQGQPAKYLKIRDTAFDKPQRANPSKMVTIHKWQHVAPTDADLAAIKTRRGV